MSVDAKVVFRTLMLVALAATMVFWIIVIVSIARWPVAETDPKPFPLEGNWFYTSAGTLLTAVGAASATALGFDVATQKPGLSMEKSTAVRLATAVSKVDIVVLISAVSYVLIGFVVAGFAALAPSEKAVQALTVYGTASIGWLVGAVGAAAAGLKQE